MAVLVPCQCHSGFRTGRDPKSPHAPTVTTTTVGGEGGGGGGGEPRDCPMAGYYLARVTVVLTAEDRGVTVRRINVCLRFETKLGTLSANSVQ